jgi:hypothetical protein
MRLLLAVLMCAAGILLATAARAQDGGYAPSPADLSASALLTTARGALAALDGELAAVDRAAQFNAALTALTGLYQLHGCQWALPQLRTLLARPDATGLHCGYSADGRVLLYVQPLDLQNPAFADYTVLLCTLESHSALELAGVTASPLTLTLADGATLQAEPLTPAHPLYNRLDKLADTFTPPSALPSGTGIAFKQLLALPRPGTSAVSAVLLSWGCYEMEVPYFETEVGQT